jgi:ferredoxin
MATPLWFVDFLKRCFPHRNQLAQLTKLPLVGRMIDYCFFEEDDVIFLPHNRVVDVHRSIDLPDEIVLPSQVVDYFIEKASHHWIMNKCVCRDSEGCKDYPIDLGCLFLGEATLGIDPRLGRMVTKDEARAHLKRCREAGLVHMVGRNKIDTFWLGVGPGSKLLTICNCCPCCCLWRVLPHLSNNISDKITKMPGLNVSVTEKCVGCGLCIQDVCFVNAIQLTNGRASINGECRGCGQCVSVCPHDAIHLSVEDDQFVNKAIQRLSRSVDVS